MDHDLPDTDAARSLVAEIATRATVAVGLAGIALIHLLDSIGKWSETRYLFWMYVALMAGSLATAGWVLFTRSRTALAKSSRTCPARFRLASVAPTKSRSTTSYSTMPKPGLHLTWNHIA